MAEKVRVGIDAGFVAEGVHSVPGHWKRLCGALRCGGGWSELDELVRDTPLELVAHDRELAEISRLAFLRFGNGRHPARLNCGDCASYALAKKYNIPLLFKGTDFAKTDIVPALAARA
jgi:ribonuclease VapC